MVNFKRLTDRARDVVDKRGGTDALKDDMQELRNIAKGKGSLKEKAAAAKDALKDPGRRDAATAPEAGRSSPPATPTPVERPRAGGAPAEKPPAPAGTTGGPEAPTSTPSAPDTPAPDTPTSPRTK